MGVRATEPGFTEMKSKKTVHEQIGLESKQIGRQSA